MAYVSYGRLIKNTVDIDQETMRLVFKDYFFSKSKRDLLALAKTLSMVNQVGFLGKQVVAKQHKSEAVSLSLHYTADGIL